jgi:hypothetical protein
LGVYLDDVMTRLMLAFVKGMRMKSVILTQFHELFKLFAFILLRKIMKNTKIHPRKKKRTLRSKKILGNCFSSDPTPSICRGQHKHCNLPELHA